MNGSRRRREEARAGKQAILLNSETKSGRTLTGWSHLGQTSRKPMPRRLHNGGKASGMGESHVGAKGLCERRVSVRRRSAHSQETITAIDGASLCRSKRHGRLDRAQSATHHHLNALARKRLAEAGHIGGDALILFVLACLAALRVVLQPFVSEEELFPCRKDELFTAIHTDDDLVLIFVHDGPPTPGSPQ